MDVRDTWGFEGGKFGHCSFKNAVLQSFSFSDCRTSAAGGGSRRKRKERDSHSRVSPLCNSAWGSAQPWAESKVHSGSDSGLGPHAWARGETPQTLMSFSLVLASVRACVRVCICVGLTGSLNRVENSGHSLYCDLCSLA